MKLTGRLSRFIISCAMLFCIWIISLLPAKFLDIVALCSFACSFVLLVILGCCVLKKKYLVFLWLLIGLTNIGAAQDANKCASSFAVSVAEGRWCLYSSVAEDYGDEVCSFIQTFDPQKVQDQDETYVLQAHVNMADRIVQAYNDMDESHQYSVGNTCTFLTAEDRDAKLDVRLKKLRSNSSPVCCAWAMQTMNQIYTSHFAERQIQTVPMMLADEKNQCWTCDVIYLLIVLINTLVYRAAPAMAAAGIFFLKWAFIFWLVIKIGMVFINRGSDKKAYSGTKFLQEFFIRTICVLAAALILGDTAIQYDSSILSQSGYSNTTRDQTMLESAYQEIVNPMFELIAGAGIEMTQALLDGKTNFYAKVAEAVQKRSELRAYGEAMQRVNYCATGTKITSNSIYQYLNKPLLGNAPSAYSTLKISGDNLFIQDNLSLNILCLTQLSFRGMAPFGAIGSIFVSYAIRNGLPLRLLPGRIPLIPQIFYGLFLNIICWLVGILVAFRLIDIMLRLAMVVMLAPVFIAVAPFPISRSYAIKGAKFFLSALMGLVEVAIAVGIIVPFFYKAIAGNSEEELIELIVASSNAQYVPNLYAFFTQNACRILIYILGVFWLSIQLFDGVKNFFKKVFGMSAASSMAKKSTLSATQKTIRSNLGATYDFSKNVNRSSKPYKNSFAARFSNTRLGGALEGLSAAGGRAYGKLEGHASVAKRRFFEETRVGRAAVATKEGTKKAYNKTAGAINKTFNFFGSGFQRGGSRLAKAGWNVSKMGYGLGSIVGIPMMLAGAATWTAGSANKLVGHSIAAAAKRAPSYAKNQLYKGIDQFFHPGSK